MAKTLLVYYSRSGNIDKVGQKLFGRYKGSVDRLEYADKKKINFFSGVVQCIVKKTVDITGDMHSPAKYDHILFMTPVWGGGVATPIRSYIKKHGSSIKSYSVIATSGGSGIDGVIKDLKGLLGKDPINSQLIPAKDISAGKFEIKKEFYNK